MRPRVLGLSVLLFLANTALAEGQPSAPADPQLSDRGRAILAYFQQLQTGSELKIVSGQFCSFGPDARMEAPDKIFQVTGRWPAVVTVDYADFKHQWVATSGPNQLLIAYWRAGGLVSVSAHLNNPARAEGGGLNDQRQKLDDLFLPGTATNQRWLHQLDDLAAGLQELQAAGVVVLWRPFHELNGNWFWWGAQAPGEMGRLWQQMFHYFTETKGLHNLIWVYSPNQGQKVGDYYPGDRFVDLVGLDAYTDNIDPEHIKGYAELTALNKPFGFTEFGPHGASQPPGDFDFRRFTAGLAANFPQTRFFFSWDMKWNPAENQFAREFYTDPRVITRTELPPGLAGDDASDLARFRAERVARLTKPDSWLSLIGRHLLKPGENSLGTAADNTIKLATGPDHLGQIMLKDGEAVFTRAPGAEVRIDGQTAQTATLNYRGEKPTMVAFGTTSFHVMQRGDSLFLRVKDTASARLKEFAGIDYFPTDPSWRIEAQWVSFTPPRQIPITNMIGQTTPAPVPGKAVFTRDGKTFELWPIDEGEDELFFVFTDLTAGTETYEASRFLYAEKAKDGKVRLDFNRAQNPPCAFTPFATCPLPPKQNALPVRVTAGEKKYRGRHD